MLRSRNLLQLAAVLVALLPLLMLPGVSPQSVFVFVHAKQTLLMNPSGIQVLS